MLEGHTEPGTISESGASDQWNVFRIDPPTRSGILRAMDRGETAAANDREVRC